MRRITYRPKLFDILGTLFADCVCFAGRGKRHLLRNQMFIKYLGSECNSGENNKIPFLLKLWSAVCAFYNRMCNSAFLYTKQEKAIHHHRLLLLLRSLHCSKLLVLSIKQLKMHLYSCFSLYPITLCCPQTTSTRSPNALGWKDTM